MPWYSAQPSLDTLLVGREHGLFHLVCYLREGDRVFETYWTKRRGAEVLDYSYALMDLTVFGRQEEWEDSPAGWPRLGQATRTLGGAPQWPPLWEWPGGRPTSQWPRLKAGYSDDLGAAGAGAAPPSGSLPLTGLNPDAPTSVPRCEVTTDLAAAGDTPTENGAQPSGLAPHVARRSAAPRAAPIPGSGTRTERRVGRLLEPRPNRRYALLIGRRGLPLQRNSHTLGWAFPGRSRPLAPPL
jgi:Bacterial protein of unknown function (DUF899)